MINVPYSVKKALKKGIYRINYKINVLTSDGTIDFTMDNSSLVSDSVNIDERMCSGDVLKFGLCEGSSLEFQYFDKPNLYGRRLQVLIEVEYPTGSTTSWYSIPMGFFEVKKCSRQADTGIMKVTAYNKLQSEYLDAEAKSLIEDTFSFMDSVCVCDFLRVLLDSYSIYEEETKIIAGGELRYPYDTESVSSYRYLSTYGEYGYLGPGWLYLYITTSSDIKIKSNIVIKEYSINQSYPLRIKPLIDFDALDDNFYNFFYDGWETARECISKTPDEMMQLMMASSFTPGTPFPYDGWFFRVIVKFQNNSIKTFSKSAYKHGAADGTFEDLTHITFEDVDKVYFIYALEVGPYYSSSFLQRHMYGEDQVYEYFGNNQEWKQGVYLTPKMPDGSDIPYMGLADYLNVYHVTNLEEQDLIEVDVETLPDNVTLRDLQSAVFEMQCQYGQLNRETDLFEGIELNKGGLYPRDDLYPSNSLYPSGASLSGSKAMYSKLWADEGNIHKWRKLVISYKGLDDNNNAVDKIMELVVDPDGTDDYLMDDNWLFKNLVWNDEDVETYANAMVTKMQDVTWFPFEMWCAGLPYLETGDMIEIPLEDKHYTSYVLQRQLKGIQDLQDTYINGTLDIF